MVRSISLLMITVSGNYAYAVGGKSGLKVLDICIDFSSTLVQHIDHTRIHKKSHHLVDFAPCMKD